MIKPEFQHDITSIYNLWIGRLVKEGDWYHERERRFLQVNIFGLIAFGSIAATYFTFREDGLKLSWIFLLALSAFAVLMIFNNIQFSKERDAARFWQKVFAIKVSQLEEHLFVDQSTGLGATINRLDDLLSATAENRTPISVSNIYKSNHLNDDDEVKQEDEDYLKLVRDPMDERILTGQAFMMTWVLLLIVTLIYTTTVVYGINFSETQ